MPCLVLDLSTLDLELGAQRQLDIIDVNVAALTQLTALLLPAMLERPHGAILNVASTAAFKPGPNQAVYCATKAYVLSFTGALSRPSTNSPQNSTAST